MRATSTETTDRLKLAKTIDDLLANKNIYGPYSLMRINRAEMEYLSQLLRDGPSSRADVLREAAKISRESYPLESEFDVRMKIAAHSIAGTLERMADRKPLDATKERT